MHTHSNDCLEEELFRCLECGMKFEAGVADSSVEGEPRCPQCGLVNAEPLAPDEEGGFVVRKTTKFR